MNKTKVLGVDFVNSSVAESVEYALQLMDNHQTKYILAANSEMMHEISRNKQLRSAARSASIVLPEGSGVVFASSILGTPIRNRISAFDFAAALMARMSEKRMTAYILGDDLYNIELSRDTMAARFPDLNIQYSDIYDFSSDIELVDYVNEIEPDLMLVCIGEDKQERWIYRHKDELNVGLIMGFSEELDVYAGISERAPKRWRDSGFEWLYWIIKEPKRLVRTLKRSWIVFAAMWRRIFGY